MNKEHGSDVIGRNHKIKKKKKKWGLIRITKHTKDTKGNR